MMTYCFIIVVVKRFYCIFILMLLIQLSSFTIYKGGVMMVVAAPYTRKKGEKMAKE